MSIHTFTEMSIDDKLTYLYQEIMKLKMPMAADAASLDALMATVVHIEPVAAPLEPVAAAPLEPVAAPLEPEEPAAPKVPQPDYNHALWPSPRAANFARSLIKQNAVRMSCARTGKRLSHQEALEVLAKYMNCDVETILRTNPIAVMGKNTTYGHKLTKCIEYKPACYLYNDYVKNGGDPFNGLMFRRTCYC